MPAAEPDDEWFQQQIAETEAKFGSNSQELALRLESFAESLKKQNRRLLDAANLKARAQVIRAKLGEPVNPTPSIMTTSQRLPGEKTFDTKRITGADQRNTIRVTGGDFGAAIWDFDSNQCIMHSRTGQLAIDLKGAIADVIVISEKSVKDQKQATLGAIAGSLVGPLGSVAGYMMAQNVKEFCVKISLNDGRSMVANIHERIYQQLVLLKAPTRIPLPSIPTAQASDDTADRYPCPFCAELIKKGAVICRFCKEKVQ